MKQDDCGNGVDEEPCSLDCGFEGGDAACNWDMSNDGEEWKMVSDGTDHTEQGDTYISVDGGGGGTLAILASQTYGGSGAGCRFKYWYRLAAASAVETTLKSEFGESLLFDSGAGDTAGQWKEADNKVKIGPRQREVG